MPNLEKRTWLAMAFLLEDKYQQEVHATMSVEMEAEKTRVMRLDVFMVGSSMRQDEIRHLFGVR